MSLIKDAQTHKFSLEAMDKQEALIMIAFLESERIRHLDDVVEIDIKIRKLQRWNGIDFIPESEHEME